MKQQQFEIIETMLIWNGERRYFLIKDNNCTYRYYAIDYSYLTNDILFHNSMLYASTITKLKSIVLKYIREEK